jgi:hypothetical protein
MQSIFRRVTAESGFRGGARFAIWESAICERTIKRYKNEIRTKKGAAEAAPNVMEVTIRDF